MKMYSKYEVTLSEGKLNINNSYEGETIETKVNELQKIKNLFQTVHQ